MFIDVWCRYVSVCVFACDASVQRLRMFLIPLAKARPVAGHSSSLWEGAVGVGVGGPGLAENLHRYGDSVVTIVSIGHLSTRCGFSILSLWSFFRSLKLHLVLEQLWYKCGKPTPMSGVWFSHIQAISLGTFGRRQQSGELKSWSGSHTLQIFWGDGFV